MKSHLVRMHEWYRRYDRPISSLSLIGGFVFDAVVLKRVDMFWENFWIVVHLLVVALTIVLFHVDFKFLRKGARRERYNFWMANVLQFTFGGLLSVYLVFYFRSASIVTDWPFLLLLFVAFVANERLKKHHEKLSFQVTLLYLSILCFSIYFIPVLIHHVGSWVFILSGLISLVVFWIFLVLLRRIGHENILKHQPKLKAIVAAIFVVVNLLYFANLIPPLPLSLKEGGVYHSVSKDITGHYFLTHEKTSFWSYFHYSQTMKITKGSPVYTFVSVFAPTGLSVDIVHVWEYWDESQEKWITSTRIPIRVIGGREDGFRTYTGKSNLTAGKWRVNVLTTRGQVIGRINFKVVYVPSDPLLVSSIK